MFCRKCGAQNGDNNYKCVQCGETLQASTSPRPTIAIPNYLVQSILLTLFCCLPFGIAAIVYSAKVNGLIAAGDIQGAIEASNKAKMWGWISFGGGLLVAILYFLAALGGSAR